jgi:GT2 family glycosyltransferase
MITPKKVSVSIVNFNKRELLRECLASVMGQTYPVWEVVVVDNASTDGSAPMVCEEFPRVKVIENPANELFCRAQNTGIRRTTGEYVLVLNNDAVLDRRFVSEMVSAMDADDNIGMVSGKILRRDRLKIDTTGLFLGKDRKPVERGYGEQENGQYEEAGYIFGAGGVAPLYRRDMLRDTEVEGEFFDETYGAFYEDLDLAWRAYRHGWSAYYAPKAVAMHVRGGTAKQELPPVKFLSSFDFTFLSRELKARLMMNRYLTMVKNDMPLDFVLNLPFIILYDLKMWAYLIVFSPSVIPEFFRKFGDFSTAWRRRKLIHGI